jgi:hypothetical protein
MPARAHIQHVNEIIGRMSALDEAVAMGRAFRVLMEDLHGRDLSVVVGPHVAAITMVRAAILRSAIGSAIACLDGQDWRGNRASVGQILNMLEDEDLAVLYPSPGAVRDAASVALRRAKADYAALIASDSFGAGRRLRNEAVAHLLIMNTPIPTVEYETIYGLQDAAERLVIVIYQIVGRGCPDFPNKRAELEANAKVFWDTYFAGMVLPNANPRRVRSPR